MKTVDVRRIEKASPVVPFLLVSRFTSSDVWLLRLMSIEDRNIVLPCS